MRAHKAMVHFSAEALTAHEAVESANRQYVQWEAAHANTPILQMSTSLTALPVVTVDGETQPGACFVISILYLYLPQ
jgi:hypothetical protein